MSFLPPWTGLVMALLLFGALAAWLLQRGLHWPAQAFTGDDVQAQTYRHIQRQHLSDLDSALAEDRLNATQYAAARDEVLRQLLVDLPNDAALTRAEADPSHSVGWAWIVLCLAVLSGGSYLQLGAPQSWWPLPLSQRVQISFTTPEQLTEQTRIWQQATQQRPDDAEAWLTLARLHGAQNAHALSEQALARVLALSPEPDLWIERAQMKALGAGGVYAGEPWQWIQNVLTAQPLHLNALVLAGRAALSDQEPAAAQAYWQKALTLVPAESEASQALQQALAQAVAMEASAVTSSQAALRTGGALASGTRSLIRGEVRVSPALQKRIPAGATLFVYAMAEEVSRRPVAIWRGVPTSWPVQFALSDSMGMGAPPLLSSLSQVRLVARISRTGLAQKQDDDLQVDLPGVKTGVQGVILNITED